MRFQAQAYRWRGHVLLPVLLALCGWMGAAQARVPVAGADDPPARVARVSYVAGDVGLLPHGADQWRDVDVNRPLTTGDRLSTGPDARLELELDNAALRLAGDSAFGFLVLDDWQTRASLTSGTLQMSVRTLPDGESYEIDTPQVAVVVDRAARLRVDLGDGEATTVSVRRGTALVYGENGARRLVAAGERYRFDSASLATAVALGAGGGEDAFSRWCVSRDQWYADADSGRYVADGTIGYRDLDRYGQWQTEVDYGRVWFPSDVGPNWVPYREGHWAWIAPWGWTWISDAPWGFAPFHYGRWMAFGGRWGWIPGPAGVRAVYAPALVAFVGGSGWRVSIGFGSAPVGWYPLGPGMVYNPWYDASRHYYWRVNHRDARRRHHRHWRDHVERAYNVWRKPERLRDIHYLGERSPHGITVVSRKVMADGRDVHGARLLDVDRQVMRKAPVRFHGVQVKPSARRHAVLRKSVLHRLPVGDFERQVVARRRPSPAARSKIRPVRTPWKSPVRLLDHDRHAARVKRPRPAKVQPQPVASTPERHHRRVPDVAPRPRAVRRHVVSPAVRSTKRHRADAAVRHLPVVPRLRAATRRHAEPAPARKPAASLPAPPRRLGTVPKPHRTPDPVVRPVQKRAFGMPDRPRPRATPHRVSPSMRAASRPRAMPHRAAPPVRAVSRPRRPAVVRRPARVRRSVPRPAPPRPVVRKTHAGGHHASSRHGNPKKPVRYKVRRDHSD